MVHYEPIKVTIDISDLVKVITNVIIHYHRVFKLIVTDQDLLFISKFWFSLYYFLVIKKKLSTTFEPQMDR